MSIDQTTLTFIIGIATIFSFVFTWYNSIRKPQQKAEVEDVRFQEKFQALEKVVLNLRDNHIHTIEQKLDKHITENQRDTILNTRQMTRIETLLEQLLKK